MEISIVKVNNVRYAENNSVIVTVIYENKNSADIHIKEKNPAILVGHPLMIAKKGDDLIAFKTTQKNDIRLTNRYKDEKLLAKQTIIDRNHKYLKNDINYDKKLKELNKNKFYSFMVPVIGILLAGMFFYLNLHIYYLYTIILLSLISFIVLILFKNIKSGEIFHDLDNRFKDFESNLKDEMNKRNNELH